MKYVVKYPAAAVEYFTVWKYEDKQ